MHRCVESVYNYYRARRNCIRYFAVCGLVFVTLFVGCAKAPPTLNDAQKRAKEFDNSTYRVLEVDPRHGFSIVFLGDKNNVRQFVGIFSDHHRDYPIAQSLSQGDIVTLKFSLEDLDPTVQEPEEQYFRYLHLEKLRK